MLAVGVAIIVLLLVVWWISFHPEVLVPRRDRTGEPTYSSRSSDDPGPIGCETIRK